MTVHDSIIVMIPEEDLRGFEQEVEDELERFSKDLGLPFKLQIDIDVGQTWS